MEIIRFGLLLTLTVALVSVATRAFDGEDDGRRAAARPTVATTHGSQSPSPATSTPGSEPTSGGNGQGDGNGSAGAGGSDGSGSGSANGSGGSGSAGSGATGGGSAGDGNGAKAGPPTLPITGPDTIVRIAGFALALIAAGGLTIASGRRTA